MEKRGQGVGRSWGSYGLRVVGVKGWYGPGMVRSGIRG